MKKINEIAGHPDVILVNGDFASHDIAAKRGKAEPHYDILQSVITQSFNQYIGAIFPKSVVIPTIGNNDVIISLRVSNLWRASQWVLWFLVQPVVEPSIWQHQLY